MAKAFRFIDGKVREVEVEGCAVCGNTSGVFKIIGDKKYCRGKCSPVSRVGGRMSTFPFTTTHFDGKPVEVTSLQHLRRLESQHGAHSAPYSWNHNNMDSPTRSTPPWQK